MLNNNIEKQLLSDDFVVSSITGNSMSPFLNDTNKVVISKVNRDIHLYDVVLYKTNDKYILHRVIDINNNKFVIRGDNRILEEYILKDDIIGILIAYYNKDEYIEINDDINKKWYTRSRNTLLFRKIKGYIKRRFSI